MADAVALALGAQEHEQGSGKVDRSKSNRRVDRIDQPAQGIEGVPGHADDGRDGDAAKHGAARSAKAIDQDGDEKAKHEDVEKLGRRGEVRPLEEGALQDLLDGLGMQLDAGHRGFERRRAKVEKARGARAYDGKTAFDLLLADLSVQHFPGRQIALLGLLGEPDPHLPVGFGRDLVVADADFDDAGLLAERLLAARAGGFDHVGRGALRDPQHVGSEGGIELVADLNHHGHAADDLVVLWQPVERACAYRLVLKFRQACRGAGIGRGEQARIVAAMGETRLSLRERAAMRCRNETEHDGALPDGFGKHLIVGGKLLDLVTQAGKCVGLRPEAQGIGRRHAVRLGEDHVETDRRGAIVGELLARARQARCAATAIARRASATPRRCRRCGAAGLGRIGAG